MTLPAADVGKVVADLRDNLARHDKPVAFLFGAGTSCCISAGGAPLIPAVAGLTAKCAAAVQAMGPEYGKAWQRLVDNCNEAGLTPHIENLLNRLRIILMALSKDDSLLGLKRKDLWSVEDTVRKTIAQTVNPSLTSIPDSTPHWTFANWISKVTRKCAVEIFTVNYDILLEHALEAQRVPYFDGFVGGFRPFFLAESLRRPELGPGPAWARLWKIHGSVTWARISIAGLPRVIKVSPTETGEMILPSFEKYDESRQQPYLAYIERLRRFLEQDDSLLITCGFSFGDEHLNSVIFESLSNRPRTHVYACQYEDLPIDGPLLSRASVLRNLTVITPALGSIGGTKYEWHSIEDIPDNPRIFVRDAATAATSKPLKGNVMLGDFSVFCEFLGSFS
jgi:hypothetical protein